MFRGSTTLAFALSLPSNGKVVGLDISDTQIDRKYWKAAGVEHKVDLMIGDATKPMQKLLENGEAGTFDLVFVDADTSNYPIYYEKGLGLLRVGRQPEAYRDEDTKVMCALNEIE